MSTVYVLLLTFFLHGGPVMTQAVTTPSKDICEQTKPLIVSDYIQNKIRLGSTDLPVDHIVPLCIRVEE